MTALILPLHRSRRRALEPTRATGAVEASTTAILAHMQAWRQSTTNRCRASAVALHWDVADECRGVRVLASDLLHISGVLHELVAGSLRGACTRNLWVGFGCRWNRLMLAVADDGGEVGPPPHAREPGAANVEYLAAESAGRIRHSACGRQRAAIFWLPLPAGSSTDAVVRTP